MNQRQRSIKLVETWNLRCLQKNLLDKILPSPSSPKKPALKKLLHGIANEFKPLAKKVLSSRVRSNLAPKKCELI